MTSTPQVDVEELKRDLLQDLKTILVAQGIQFPDNARVMIKEESRSSLAATAGVG
jgi:hypothetical protein